MWSALILVLSLICFLGLRRPLPQVVLLPLPEPKPTRLQATIEQSWAWLQARLPGLRQSILVRAKVLGFKRHPGPMSQLFGDAAARTDQVEVCVLGEGDLDRATRRLEQTPDFSLVSQPSIQAPRRTRGYMTAGNTVVVSGKPEFVGLELSSFPDIRDGNVDLISGLKWTTPLTNQDGLVSVRTNFAVRARIQVPRRGGALLLSRDTNGAAAALILTAKVL